MRPRLSPLLLVSLAAILAAPVQADPQQARDLIVGAFEKTAADLQGHGTLSWGTAEVSTVSGGDLVVLPEMRFAGDEATLEVGRVEFLVTDFRSSAGKARQRIAMTLPGKMTVTAPNQTPVDISFASGSFVASWAPDLES